MLLLALHKAFLVETNVGNKTMPVSYPPFRPRRNIMDLGSIHLKQEKNGCGKTWG